MLSRFTHLLRQKPVSCSNSSRILFNSARFCSLVEPESILQAEELDHKSPKTATRTPQHMNVRAIHIARKMDIVQLFQKLYTDRYKVSHFLHKDSVVLRLRGKEEPSSISPILEWDKKTPSPSVPDEEPHTFRAKDKYVVYFDYGACVFFNCDEPLVKSLTKHAKRFCTNVFDLKGHGEEIVLIADSRLKQWSVLRDNCMHLQQIDPTNIQVIAGVLGQTVALEHYERQVDAILDEFEILNTAVEKNGPGESLLGLGLGLKQTEKKQKKKLFQIVATNNTLLIDLISKLRVIDRKRPGDVAWNNIQYHEMWEKLQEEYELNERFNNLNFKLELIQHNTKFFLEVLGEHKGERLEWYIIFLISAELAISVYELFT